MSGRMASLARRAATDRPALPDAASVLSALPMPAVVLDANDQFRFANQAAEQFFQQSIATLMGMSLGEFLAEDSRVFALLRQVRIQDSPVSDHDLLLQSPRLNRSGVSAHGAPLPE
ncbi:MAG: PAS domain-containing protein, partial [Alphaproteobacteria bacterium]|nr:PAS domain-containing protein [Alphaproteobacteria bacterium]